MNMIYVEDCCEILDSKRDPITASAEEKILSRINQIKNIKKATTRIQQIWRH